MPSSITLLSRCTRTRRALIASASYLQRASGTLQTAALRKVTLDSSPDAVWERLTISAPRSLTFSAINPRGNHGFRKSRATIPLQVHPILQAQRKRLRELLSPPRHREPHRTRIITNFTGRSRIPRLRQVRRQTFRARQTQRHRSIFRRDRQLTFGFAPSIQAAINRVGLRSALTLAGRSIIRRTELRAGEVRRDGSILAQR